MATTAVVAEILIVGLEAAAWISLLVFAAFGTDWVHRKDLETASHWVALETVVVLAVAYALGILIDRLADDAHGVLKRRFRGRPVKKPAKIPVMRMTVLHEGGAMSTFVDYQRSRFRIARATVLNLALLALAAIWFFPKQADLAWWWTALVVALILV